MRRIIITEEQFKNILLSEQKVYSDFDRSYDYRVVNGKWQGKKKSGGNWFSLDKYTSSIKKLDDRYPNARKVKSSTEKKTTTSTKKTSNVNKELDNQTKNQTGSKYLNLAKSRIGKNSWMMATVTESPFKNKSQGDAFRKWLNDTLPKTAKKLDVDPPSNKTSYKNKYIVNALNHVIPMKSGNEMTIYGYYTYKNPEWMNIKTQTSKRDWDQKTELKRQKIEAGVIKVPEVVKNAERINKEVAFINARKEYDGKPFFIADPRLNLVVAFDEKHNYIAHSQSVAGKDAQKPVTFTYKQWCEASGANYIEITNHQSGININGCFKKGVKIDDIADAKSSNDKDALKDLKPKMDYGILKKTKDQYAGAGIYQVSGVGYGKYTGDKSNIDSYMLQTKDGVLVGTAIHALVQVNNRIKADKQLKQYLTNELQSGEIPNEYIEMVEKDFLRKEEGRGSKYDLSAGCFNVDPKFATNPKVQEIGKKRAFVFILSEKDVDYLVQVEKGKEGDFFLDAGGKKEGFCKSPSQLTDDYGEMVA